MSSDDGHISLVLEDGDVTAAQRLAGALDQAVNAARGVCRTSVVILEPWDAHDAGNSAFARALQMSLGRHGHEDVEVTSVGRGEVRWIRDTAVLLPLGAVGTDIWVGRQAARYGASIVSDRPLLPFPGITGVHLRSITAGGLRDARTRRARVLSPVPAPEERRLARFLDEVASRRRRKA